MTTEQARHAIVNNIETTHNVVVVCEHRVYDVWGNAREGWEVNDAFSNGRIEIPCTLTIANVPIFPGGKDEHRSFPACSSFVHGSCCATSQRTNRFARRPISNVGLAPVAMTETSSSNANATSTRFASYSLSDTSLLATTISLRWNRTPNWLSIGFVPIIKV